MPALGPLSTSRSMTASRGGGACWCALPRTTGSPQRRSAVRSCWSGASQAPVRRSWRRSSAGGSGSSRWAASAATSSATVWCGWASAATSRAGWLRDSTSSRSSTAAELSSGRGGRSGAPDAFSGNWRSALAPHATSGSSVGSAMADWPRRIGDLATATGVTVRALHHYDEIGLLVPRRSEAGQRLYTQADLLRLYQIVALRRLGFAIPEIAARLDNREFDPREVVRRQLAELRRQMELQERLRGRLTGVLDALDRAHEPTAEDLIDGMEVINEREQYYTPEQLRKIEAHRRELGDEGLGRGQEAWAELIPLMVGERQRGTDPADPRVQE